MNFVIDIGNTKTKAGLFHQNRLIDTWISEKPDAGLIKKIKAEYDKHSLNVILSTVKEPDKSLLTILNRDFDRFLLLGKNILLPFENHYETKETLGYDRIAAIAGAHQLSPNTNILVIDMGTAITFDIINDKNQFIGGNISPGLEMRCMALHDYTAKLPKIKPSGKAPLIGNTTKTAIDAGIQNSIVFEIKGYIKQFAKQFTDLKIFLTGGNTFFFDNKLKNTIFVYPNLGLIGLNHILIYNVDKKN